jgi:hypothetical protein
VRAAVGGDTELLLDCPLEIDTVGARVDTAGASAMLIVCPRYCGGEYASEIALRNVQNPQVC